MSKRKAIIAEKENSEIIKLLKVVKFTVYHFVNKCKELGTSKNCPRSERSLTAPTKNVIKAVLERVERNSRRFARPMTKDMNVILDSMRDVFKNYFQLSPYKRRKRQYLTPA